VIVFDGTRGTTVSSTESHIVIWLKVRNRVPVLYGTGLAYSLESDNS